MGSDETVSNSNVPLTNQYQPTRLPTTQGIQASAMKNMAAFGLTEAEKLQLST